MYLSIKKLAATKDIQSFFEAKYKDLKPTDRLIINTKQTLSEIFSNNNWLTNGDIVSILNLSGFEVISNSNSKIVSRKKSSKIKDYSVSIIIPARNESKNIDFIVSNMPKFGKKQELIFIEGGSNDDTFDKIKQVLRANKSKNIKLLKQKGNGKADAIHLGLSVAKGDVLITYDSDATVDPRELVKFYNALKNNNGEFINGSRLVYPMEKDAMQTLNKIANYFFGFSFTKILGQRFKDTLCGTKALFRKDYLKIQRYIKKHKTVDPFGDFDLIFGAIRQNLKVVEIPVHYKERVYGTTNIRRFYHGILLLKMLIWAILEFKFSQRQDTQ